MAKINYNLRLDVNKNGSQGIIYAREGDTRTRAMVISLYKGASPVEMPTGAAAVLQIARTDDTFSLTDCTIDGNTVTVDVSSYMTACEGNNECQLIITDPVESGVLYSPSFDLYVEVPIIDPSNVEALDQFNALTSAIAACTQYKTQWGSPTMTVELVDTEDEVGGSIEYTDGGAVLNFKIMPQVASLGDKNGYLVETGEDGVLQANRRLIIGTEDPESMTTLLPGDIYVKY